MRGGWPETSKVESIQGFADLLSEFTTSSTVKGLIYRGQPDWKYHLRPSVDRFAPKRCEYLDRLEHEVKTMQEFREAYRFLGSLERNYMNGPQTTRMMIMQHFGAPTRLLDWTYSVTVAAYFACIHDPSKDGTIWWVDAKAVESFVDKRWKKWGFKRYPKKLGRQIILDDGIFKPEVAEFVTLLSPRVQFSRAEAQKAMFTLGSRLGVDHDAVLTKQLSEGEYGRITIRADVKRHVLGCLEKMGVNAISLQYPGADLVGSRITEACKRRRK
jgi:hypothetical protein